MDDKRTTIVYCNFRGGYECPNGRTGNSKNIVYQTDISSWKVVMNRRSTFEYLLKIGNRYSIGIKQPYRGCCVV